MTSNLTPARFVRMVWEWMDQCWFDVPMELHSDDNGWNCRVGGGKLGQIVANWNSERRCLEISAGGRNIEPTEQGLTDALIELACRMEKGK